MIHKLLKLLKRAKTIAPEPSKKDADVLARVKFPCC